MKTHAERAPPPARAAQRARASAVQAFTPLPQTSSALLTDAPQLRTATVCACGGRCPSCRNPLPFDTHNSTHDPDIDVNAEVDLGMARGSSDSALDGLAASSVVRFDALPRQRPGGLDARAAVTHAVASDASRGSSTVVQRQTAAEPDVAEEEPREDGASDLLVQRISAADDDDNAAAPHAAVQTKLTIGAPGDRYEQEADRVAEQVVGGAATHVSGAPRGEQVQRAGCAPLHRTDEDVQRAAQSSATTVVQRQEADEDDKTCAVERDPNEPAQPGAETSAGAEGEGESEAATAVQPKTKGQARAAHASLENHIVQRRGNGQPLPVATRAFMEQRFGYDFGRVRVHVDHAASVLNRDLNSYAFTTGHDIFFVPHYYRPGTRGGDRLLAHELTHVVQQNASGARAVIQRKGDFEDKDYYRREPVTGRVVHHYIERELRTANSAWLVTEAPIPGANRFMSKVNTVGFADLYKAMPAKKIAGVRGLRELTDAKDVINMPRCGTKVMNTQPCDASNRGPARAAGAGGARGWNGDFPEQIWVGEIKPLSVSNVAAGMYQLGNYQAGFAAFVRKVNELRGQNPRAELKTGLVSSLQIPEGLNFDKFGTPAGQGGKGRVLFGEHRYWLSARGQDRGIYTYFHVHKDYDETRNEPWMRAQKKKIDAISKELSESHPKTPGMQVSGKFRGPLPVSTLGATRVQRQAPRAKGFWKAKGKQWESKRATWAQEVKRYLRGPGKELKRVMHIYNKLGMKRHATDARRRERAKTLAGLGFWSSTKGKFVGKIRFLLGGAFDRIQAVFAKMKQKMAAARAGLKNVGKGGFLVMGWKRKLINVLVKAAKIGVARFITMSFNVFAECFNYAMLQAVEMFKAEMSEKYAKELCDFKNKYHEARDRIETEWGGVLDSVKGLIAHISDVTKWIEIATTLISAIRVGVQIVSCLTPPALGCLWGLVAQVGLSAALNLLIGTRWFNDNIINPTIGKIVRKYATDTYKNLINRALGPDLQRFHCPISDIETAVGGGGDPFAFHVGGGIDGAALRRHRDAWERTYGPALVKLLGDKFAGGNGQPASRAELEALIRMLEKLSPEERKKLLERARRADGKISAPVASALGAVQAGMREGFGTESEKGAAPPAPAPRTEAAAPGQPKGSAGGGARVALPRAGTEAAEGEAAARTRVQATAPPAGWNPAMAKDPLRWIIVHGMHPSERYKPGEVRDVVIDVFMRGQEYTVFGVKLVYLNRRIVNDKRFGRFTEFEVYFKEHWYAAQVPLFAVGGIEHKTWHRFPRE